MHCSVLTSFGPISRYNTFCVLNQCYPRKYNLPENSDLNFFWNNIVMLRCCSEHYLTKKIMLHRKRKDHAPPETWSDDFPMLSNCKPTHNSHILSTKIIKLQKYIVEKQQNNLSKHVQAAAWPAVQKALQVTVCFFASDVLYQMQLNDRTPQNSCDEYRNECKKQPMTMLTNPNQTHPAFLALESNVHCQRKGAIAWKLSTSI